MAGLFITGTDTGVGKTEVTAALVRLLNGRGRRAVAMKPVASGTDHDVTGAVLQEDIEALRHASLGTPAAERINCYCLTRAAAPEYAAREEGIHMSLPTIEARYADLAAHWDDVMVEGVGGWLVPLSDRLDLPDLARALGLPVLFVVGLRLGCINHARLTEQVLLASGVPVFGWVSSACDPSYEDAEATTETLRNRLATPHLGALPHRPLGDAPPPVIRSMPLPGDDGLGPVLGKLLDFTP